MAGKECTVYILDLGQSMGESRHGRSKTNLEWAMEYVWDKITTTVATGRKTAMMGVIGYRTDETDLQGIIEEEDGYSNVHVFAQPKQFLLPDIRELQQHIKSSKTNDGDILSAMAVAIQMIDQATQGKTGNRLKYDRRIIVVTDGQGYSDTEDLDAIASKLRIDEIELTLLGVDFDDAEAGIKEENKDSVKAENEKTLADFVDKSGGNFGTLAEAIEQMEIPRMKSVRPVHSFIGTLTFGDPENYDSAMSIDVERYPCTMVAKPPTASSFVQRMNYGAPGPSDQSSTTMQMDEDRPMNGNLSAVRNARKYVVDNPDEQGQKMEVEMEDLEKGFEYGRTAVHVAEADQNITKLETTAGFSILGFIVESKFERFLPMSRSNYIVAQKLNTKAQLALSAFIHALYEAECYAVARLVTKDLRAPLVVLLVPRIEGDLECLMEVELPFEEDMRRYKFPPLDKKLTISGKVITEHRDIPNSDLMGAMSDYVDAMDLSTFGRDDDGEPAEYMKCEDTYSPLLHRVNQIIRWRATTDVYDKLPDPPQILTKYSAPPSDLMARAESQLSELKKAGDVKKVPPKQKGRFKRRREDRGKPLSGLDVDELLGNPKRVKIDPNNLIPTFKQALAATDDMPSIEAAVAEMDKNIRNLISNSIGDSGYGRALEAIRVTRDELAEFEEPDIYNKMIRKLKEDLKAERLKGDRREMWWKIKGSQYGLIDRKRCHASDVTEEEAREFYQG